MYDSTKALCFTLACRNFPMKSNCCNPALFLEEYDRKYFRLLIDAVGDQVSRMIYLFCNYPLSKILNFNLSRLLSDYLFAIYIPMQGITVSPLLG